MKDDAQSPQHGVAARCHGCNGRIPPPTRVTHFEKRFCSPRCRVAWTTRRWNTDALVVRRYFFHYLQFHKHPDYHAAGRMQEPCTYEFGHAHFLESLGAACDERRKAQRCRTRGADEVPVNGARLPMNVELGPSLRDSLRVLEHSDPETRRVLSHEYDTERGREQRFYTDACFFVQKLLMFGKCTNMQYEPRVLRPVQRLGENGLPRPNVVDREPRTGGAERTDVIPPDYVIPDDER